MPRSWLRLPLRLGADGRWARTSDPEVALIERLHAATSARLHWVGADTGALHASQVVADHATINRQLRAEVLPRLHPLLVRGDLGLTQEGRSVVLKVRGILWGEAEERTWQFDVTNDPGALSRATSRD